MYLFCQQLNIPIRSGVKSTIQLFCKQSKGIPYINGKFCLSNYCIFNIVCKPNRQFAENPTMAVPKISGQDKDYLVRALRAYRDGKRGSSMMHRMSLPYSETIIESVASLYANQPAR